MTFPAVGRGLLLLLSFKVSTFALPQDARGGKGDSSLASDSTRYELAPIIVTATRSEREIDRVPYAVGVVTQNEIQRAKPGLSLDEALRAMPGVLVNNRFNLSQGDRLSIRGLGGRAPFGVRGVKVILDGIPLTLPDGQSQLNNLDLGSASKIEVLRGPASSLYGNAAGGLIDIRTESEFTKPVQIAPQFIAGSYGLRKWQAKISGHSAPQSYLINLSHLQLEGYREHSAAQSTAVNAVAHRELSQHAKLSAVFNYFNAPYLLNPSSLSKNEVASAPSQTRFFIKQQGAGKHTSQGQGGLTFRHYDETTHLEATLFGLSRDLSNPIPGRIIELDRNSGGLRTVLGKRGQFGAVFWRGTAGMDYERQRDTRVEFANLGIPSDQVEAANSSDVLDLVRYGERLLDQKESVDGIGAFVEIECAPHPAWALTAGGRVDRYDFEVEDYFLNDGIDDSGARRMEKFSPMLGLNYRAHALVSFYGNVATAFQTPTTTELGNQPDREGGLHPTLQPERVISYELGVKGAWLEIRCQYEVSVFHFRVEDMLIPYQIAGNESEEVYYRNAGQARNRGIEAGVQWTLARGWRAEAAYAFMDFVFKDFLIETMTADSIAHAQLAGNQIPGVPRHRLSAGLAYEHNQGFFAEIDLQWVDRYFANDFNGPSAPGVKPQRDFINEAYRSVDLRTGFRPRRQALAFEFFLGINNVFAESYNGSIVPNAAGDRFFEPAPGRNWYVGGSVKL